MTKPTTGFDPSIRNFLLFYLIWGPLFYRVTPRSPVIIKQRFGVTYRVALQGGYLLGLYYSVFGLHLEPEDEGDMFLRNVSWLLPDYTALHSRYFI
jgi:hypothetical protein